VSHRRAAALALQSAELIEATASHAVHPSLVAVLRDAAERLRRSAACAQQRAAEASARIAPQR
jgi:hypothetical protein